MKRLSASLQLKLDGGRDPQRAWMLELRLLCLDFFSFKNKPKELPRVMCAEVTDPGESSVQCTLLFPGGNSDCRALDLPVQPSQGRKPQHPAQPGSHGEYQ